MQMTFVCMAPTTIDHGSPSRLQHLGIRLCAHLHQAAAVDVICGELSSLPACHSVNVRIDFVPITWMLLRIYETVTVGDDLKSGFS